MRKYALIAALVLMTAPAMANMDHKDCPKEAFKATLTEHQRECIKTNCPKFTKEEKAHKSEADWRHKRECYESCGVHKDWECEKVRSKMKGKRM